MSSFINTSFNGYSILIATLSQQMFDLATEIIHRFLVRQFILICNMD